MDMVEKIGSGKNRDALLSLLQNHPKITIPEIAAQLNKATRTIERQIQGLKGNVVLRRVGSTKAGSWQIIG